MFGALYEILHLFVVPRLGLSYAELIQVGQMCKRLLDIGRMKRLEQLGLKCELMVCFC